MSLRRITLSHVIAYLDIETDYEGQVTVVGLLRPGVGLVQFVDTAVDGLARYLDGVDTLCTYNGDGFDLPILGRRLGVDLLADFRSLDLLTECRRLAFRGGLKAVEARLGISRNSVGLTGRNAMALWLDWKHGDVGALETLLAYNAEDVINLVTLERRLRGELDLPADVARSVVRA